MAKIISRFQYGVSLNSREYVLDDKGNLKKFNSDEDARAFLIKTGFKEEDINERVFIDDEEDL